MGPRQLQERETEGSAFVGQTIGGATVAPPRPAHGHQSKPAEDVGTPRHPDQKRSFSQTLALVQNRMLRSVVLLPAKEMPNTSLRPAFRFISFILI